MNTYTLINGRKIQYQATDAEQAFIDTVLKLAAKKTSTEDELVAMVYGVTNPILAAGPLPGHAMVTPAVFANPIYHLLTDIIFRKHCQTAGTTAEELAEPYTLSVAETAAKLGLSRQAVLNAINSYRIPAWFKGDQYFVDPKGLAAFKMSPRGLKPADGTERASTFALASKSGSKDGRTLHVKHATKVVVTSNVVEGDLIGPWRRVGVFTAEKSSGKMRFFELAPGPNDDAIEFDPFFVRGRFEIVTKINNSRKARDAWEAFKPQ